MAVRTVSDSGGNWSSGTTWVGGVVPVNGDEVVFTPTSGNIVVDVSTANLIGINFTNYVGTITFNNNINVFTTINLGTGGYTQAGSFGLNIISSVTGFTSNSVVWSRRLTFTGVNVQTYTLLDNLFVTGDIIFSVGSAHVLNGFNLYIRGNLTLTSSGTIQGTTNFIINGDTTWSSAGSLIRNNLEINTTGSTTISGTVYYAGNTLKYVTANTITTSGSTLSIGNLSGTILETSGMTWDNIIFNGGNPTLVGDLNVNGNLSTNVSGAQILGNFNINVGGNFTLGGQVYGDATIVLNGVGNQTWSGNFALRLSMTINKPSGNFIVSGNVIFQGDSSDILNYINADNTITVGSTLNLLANSTLNTSGMTWNNVTIGVSTTTSNVTLNSDLYMSGNLLIQGTQAKTINGVGRRVYVGGDMTINSTTSGSATIELNGSSNQTWSSTSYLGNSLTINKSTGNLNLSSNVYYQSGSLVYSAGTVVTTGNTLNIGTSTTLDTNGITWNNILCNTTSTLTLNSILVWSGTLSLLTGSPGTVTFAGTSNLSPISTSNVIIGNGTFAAGGSTTVNFSTSTVLNINNLTIRCAGNSVSTFSCTMNNVTFNISGDLLFSWVSQGLCNINGTSSSIVLVGSGSRTVTYNGSGAGNSLQVNNISLTVNCSGTYTFSTSSNTPRFVNSLITYTSGSVAGSEIVFQNCTLNLNNGGQWGTDVDVRGNATLTSNATFGNLKFSTSSVVLSGAYTMNVKQNLNINVTTSGSSSTLIELNGTGNQSWSYGSIVYLSANLTINKPSGILSLGSNTYYSVGTLTYSAGTVDVTSNTLNIGGNSSLNTSGLTWNNFTCNITSTITLISSITWSGVMSLASVGNVSITFAGSNLFLPTPSASMILGHANFNTNTGNTTITFPSSTVLNITTLSIRCGGQSSAGFNCTINNISFNVSGDLTCNYFNQNTSYILGTSTSITMVGSGTVNFTGNNSGLIMQIPFTVNASGTYTFAGLPFFSSNVTYITGVTTGTTCYFITGANLNLNSGGKWGTNVTMRGNITLSSNATFGNLTTEVTSVVLSGAFTVNVEGDLTINITTSGSLTPIVINGTGSQIWSHGSAVNLSNNLTINKPSGTLIIGNNVYYSTGVLTHSASTVDASSNLSTLNIGGSCTLDTSGVTWYNIATRTNTITTTTITLNSNIFWSNLLSLLTNAGGTVTFTGVGTLSPNSLSANLSLGNSLFLGLAGTTTINFPVSSNFNINNLTLGCGGQSSAGFNCVINNATINVNGNFNVNYFNQNISRVTGTSSQINMVGTGTISQTFIGGSSGCFISIPFTINTPNSYTLSANAFSTFFFENTTVTYTSGTLSGIKTTFIGCTLNLDSGGKWGTDVALRSTTTLTSNATFGNLTTETTTVSFVGSFDVNVEGNLAINISTVGANTPIYFKGSGNQSWAHGSAVYLTNNLIINKSGGTLTLVGNIYYRGGILTYTSGSVDTTTNNSTLNSNLSTTFATNGMSWNNVILSGTSQTFTFTNNFTLTGTLTLSGTTSMGLSSSSINTGGLTINTTATVSGTASINFTGTGTWNHSSAGYLLNNVNIDTSGNTLTLGANIYYSVNTITYISGTVDSSTNSSTLNIFLTNLNNWLSVSLDTTGMSWYNIVFTSAGGSVRTFTLTSDLSILNDFILSNGGAGTTTTYVGNGSITCNALRPQPSNGNAFTLNFNNTNIYTNDLLTDTSTAGTSTTMNGANLYISRNIRIGNSNLLAPFGGTVQIYYVGSGTWTTNQTVANQSISANFTINTSGVLTISRNVYFAGPNTFTYRSGKVNTKNSTLNITGNSTFVNCNKINFDRVVITSGVNLTMNEFFCGSPGLKTTVSPSSTTNYTITFNDSLEKFAFHTKLSRATISRKNQLTVVTDRGNNLNNVGVKFAPNQLPNGLPKNNPLVSNQPMLGTFLVSEPIYN